MISERKWYNGRPDPSTMRRSLKSEHTVNLVAVFERKWYNDRLPNSEILILRRKKHDAC